jgi:hypothetical protein
VTSSREVIARSWIGTVLGERRYAKGPLDKFYEIPFIIFLLILICKIKSAQRLIKLLPKLAMILRAYIDSANVKNLNKIFQAFLLFSPQCFSEQEIILLSIFICWQKWNFPVHAMIDTYTGKLATQTETVHQHCYHKLLIVTTCLSYQFWSRRLYNHLLWPSFI